MSSIASASAATPGRGSPPWTRASALAAALVCCSEQDVVYVSVAPRDAPPRRAGAASPPNGTPDDAGRTDGGGLADPPASDPSLPRCQTPLPRARARNVILMLADGYAGEQIEATRRFVSGNESPLPFEDLPFRTTVTTLDARGLVTDSAASATAMATGRKVDSLVVSRAIPGDGEDLTTALEYQRARGKATGLVTTHIPLTDATPAAFGAHANSRYDAEPLAQSLFETRPNVAFGAPAPGFSALSAQAAGYAVVRNAHELALLPTDTARYVAGPFPEPTDVDLRSRTAAALDVLGRADAGFFLLVEQEGTDTFGHSNSLPDVLAAALEFVDAVELAIDWAGGRDDTLLVVGGDHETGGLQLLDEAPVAGVVPAHAYSTTAHTDAVVPFFAAGPGAEVLPLASDNADLFPLLSGLDVAEYSTLTCEAGVLVSSSLSSAAPNGGSTAAAQLPVSRGPAEGGEAEQQALLRFATHFAELPASAQLASARLVLRPRRTSDVGFELHRMLREWTSDDGWADFGGDGVQLDGLEAEPAADARTGPVVPSVLGLDVTASVRRWLQDPERNLGWVLVSGPGGSTSFDVADGVAPPRLLLYYD